MASISRGKNSVRNIFWGSINQIVKMCGPFLIRTIMIQQLGSLYLGLNTLFTTILQVLNMSELGFSNAVVYCMYKSVAEDDKLQIGKLLKFFKHIYEVIGVLIFVIGCALMPALPLLISGTYPRDVNIYLVYFMYLVNTALSYWLFGYKSSLFQAYQRNDYDSRIESTSKFVLYVTQIAVLLIWKNYYFYLVLLPLTTLLSNIIRYIIVSKLYPDIIPAGELDRDTRSEIWKKVKALLVYKIGNTVSNSVDNIVISAFLGLSILTVYNNYYYIISSLFSFLTVYYNSIKGGLGNSVVIESVEKNKRDFYNLFFLQAWIIGFCSISLVVLYQPFMEAWIGTDYLLPFSMVILFAIYFYSWKIHDVVHTYKDALGLWNEDRYRPLLSAIINLCLNLFLVRQIGLYGIVISTIVSELIFSLLWAPKVLFDRYFKCPLYEYYVRILKYTFITVLCGFFVLWIAEMIDISVTGITRIDSLLVFAIRAIIVLVLTNLMYFFIYRNSKELLFWKKKIVDILKK